jgi:subtilisin family serine protease
VQTLSELTHLVVFVRDAQGNPIEKASVRAEASAAEGESRSLEEVGGGRYEQELPPGSYEVHVSTRRRELQPETAKIAIERGTSNVEVVLGREGQRFYYAGDMRIYFEPDEESFLVAVRGERARRAVPAALKRRNLEIEELPSRLQPGAERPEPEDTSFVSVRLPGGQRVDDAGDLVESVVADLERRGFTVIPALHVRRGEGVVEGLTNELVVRFDESVTTDQAYEIARSVGLEVLRPVNYAGNAFLLGRPGPPSYDILRAAEELRRNHPVRYAEPNLLLTLELDQFTPNDTLWANLTHLPLINCDDAWQTLGAIAANLQGGSPAITIGVFDPDGVAPNHPELTANLTDGTSKLVVDFNFNAMAAQTVAGLGGDHGTQCAGSATAAFNNARGIAGVAPNCHLIGARIPSPATGIEMADAFIWAAGFNTGTTNPSFPALPARAADVISNSWGVSNAVLSSAMRDCFDFLTVYGRGGRGCVVTFSTGNLGYVQFSNVRRFAAYERTIAVGASINANPTSPVNSAQADPNGNTNNIAVAVDTRTLYCPFGPEMDIVAPSHTAYAAGTGALIDPITSCVRVGTGALNGCAPPAAACNDYAATFGGTSHASPTVAGAAALILSVRPALSWVEVRRILRGTAVRIDFAQANLTGQWVDNDGDGIREFSQWYGYGRLDVDAAVRAARDWLAAPDIVVRENLSDTGAVPSPGWHAHSPDIWVRRTDDPIPALAYLAEPPHQSPRRGQDNFVFCRVKNVGTAPSSEIYVRAMLTHYPGFEFRYPQEFTPTNRPGAPVPSPLTPGTYLIGETRIANLGAGADQIVKMRWPQALVPPATVMVGGTTVTWHPCLLLEASPHDGPLPAGATFDIKRNNNIAQRNIAVLDPGDPASDLFIAIIAGSSSDAGVEGLVVDRRLLSPAAAVHVRLADDLLMRELLEYVRKHRTVPAPPRENGCGIRVVSPARLAIECDDCTVVIEAPKGTRVLLGKVGGDIALEAGHHQGVDSVEIGPGTDHVELPLRLRPREFTLVLVAVTGDRHGELRLTQRRGDGDLSAGFSVVAGEAGAAS